MPCPRLAGAPSRSVGAPRPESERTEEHVTTGRRNRNVQPPSFVREAAVLGALYLVALVAIAASIGAVLNRHPTAFVVDLFTDPVWLFGTAFGLALLVRWARKRRERTNSKTD